MGAWDVPILVIAAGIGGYFIIQNPEIFGNLFGGDTTNGEPVEEEDGGDGEGEENGGGGGGSDSECKKYCSNCYCKSYHEKCEGRGKSCSGCKGGNRTGKCGGSGGGAGGSGGSTSSKSDDCRNFCNRGWCDSYRKRGCTGGCATCIKGGIAQPSGSGCPQKVIGSNCAGNCHTTCWHGRYGSKVVDHCISKSISTSACNAARDSFCKKYGVGGKCSSGNLAFAYDTYPHSFGRMTIA